MPFPPGDVVAAFGRHLHFQSLASTLRERHPELAERVHFDDSQGRMLLKVTLYGGQSIGLAHIRMGYAIVWAVLDPDLNSEPSLWPLDTPDDVLVDIVHAYASAHLAGEPVPSPWRWHESETSAMTELADLLDSRGAQVQRVVARNGYFAYGPRLAPKLDIVSGRDGSFLEAEFPAAFVRISLKPALGWLVDVHTPRWGGWDRIALGRCLGRTSSPSPGVPSTDVSVQEIAEVLCDGPEAWDMEPSCAPAPTGKQSAQESGTPLLDRLFRPVQGIFPDYGDEPDEGEESQHRPNSLAPGMITKDVLQQLTALGFSDLFEGGADLQVKSNTFHIEWHRSTKNLSTSAIQRLNGVASAAGDSVPKRLIVITGAGLTRPAAAFADKAKAYVFYLDDATGQLTGLNSLAREALPPVDAPGGRLLESW
ncbi:hypothetical protein [Streptomyces sp. NPDC006638]|uniref:hypothetical protein n=1 Tax=Streptomyces sp. NPDC006638 TaxID=3157183 RepID=UPI0033B64565